MLLVKLALDPSCRLGCSEFGGDLGRSASAKTRGGVARLHLGSSAQQRQVTSLGPHGIPLTSTRARADRCDRRRQDEQNESTPEVSTAKREYRVLYCYPI